jgi:hypothetical protein
VAILVDLAIWPFRGRKWAHLVSDTSHEELHAFAATLGLQRGWFQGDHYDIPSEVRLAAIELGAEPVGAGELVRRLRAAGLRDRSRITHLPGEPPTARPATARPATARQATARDERAP